MLIPLFTVIHTGPFLYFMATESFYVFKLLVFGGLMVLPKHVKCEDFCVAAWGLTEVG